MKEKVIEKRERLTSSFIDCEDFFRKVKQKKFFVFSVVFFLTLFIFTTYRAFTTSITYDEAHTYLFYAKNFSWNSFSYFIKPGAIANNHFLNTLFIAGFDKVFNLPYNEFIIRLPNLLSYLGYFLFAYKISSLYKSKCLILSLFIFNYGAHEFFGLARGYGMASTFVLGGIYFYKIWNKDRKKYFSLAVCYTFLLLGCFANTTVLLILATILIDSGIRLLVSKSLIQYFKKSWYLLVPIIAGILLNINYHFLISAENLPLYGGKGSFFENVIKSVFIVYGFEKYTILIIGGFLLIIFVGFLANYKNVLKKNLWIVSIIYFLLLIFITIITNQLWLTGRTLLPVIPLLIFSFAEYWENVFSFKQKSVLEMLIVLTVLVTFCLNLNLYQTRTWKNNYEIKEQVYNCYQEGEQDRLKEIIKDYNPAITFYQEKIEIYGL